MDDALATAHADHGARFTTVGGERTVADYGRPAVAHRAVRSGVGVIHHPHDVLELEGPDRLWALQAIGLAVPAADGTGAYGVATDDGRIVAAAHAFAAAERTILVTPPGVGSRIRDRVDGAGEATATLRGDVTCVGVHGANATEKIASVTPGSAPAERLSFDRLTVADAAATVIRTDAPAGEPGYFVVVDRADGPATFDALLTHGLNAAPFGDRTWDSLTLEAGTPRFHQDLAGRNGSLVAHCTEESAEGPGGSEAWFAGVVADEPLAAGGNVESDDGVGTITRSARGPSVDGEIGLAALSGLPNGACATGPGSSPVADGSRTAALREATTVGQPIGPVRVEGTAAELVGLPFLASGERSGRCQPFGHETA